VKNVVGDLGSFSGEWMMHHIVEDMEGCSALDRQSGRTAVRIHVTLSYHFLVVKFHEMTQMIVDMKKKAIFLE